MIDSLHYAHNLLGLAEMRHCIEPTGGVVVMAEEYCHDVFRESIRRMLATDNNGHLPLAGNAIMEVRVGIEFLCSCIAQ